MLSILCKNELTGVVTEVTEITDLSIFDELESALNTNEPPSGDIFRYEIPPLTFVTSRKFTYRSASGRSINSTASDEYIRSTIYQFSQFISEQIGGYIAFSHDIQYFVGAIRNYSAPADTQIEFNYAEKFEKIQALSNLMHAKATYFRFLTDNIDILDKINISVLDKIETLGVATEAMSELYDKTVKIRIVTTKRPTLYTYDLFEFVPLAIIENAVKYGPRDGVAIAFNIEEYPEDFRLEIGSMGPTIPNDEFPRVMSRSFRATTTRRIASGHGMGLFQANIGARKLFNGKLSFRQPGPIKLIDGIDYSRTVVSIHMPKGNISDW